MEKENDTQKEDNTKKDVNFTIPMTKEEEDWYYYEAWLREKKQREYEELVNNKCDE